jgi:precorrin-3B C17-methyltransferase
MGKIYVVGMGPGREAGMTEEAKEALAVSDVLIGYTVYIDLLRERYPEKELLTTGMKQEVERCRLCLEQAESGKTVSLVCSGDAGVYGMASLMLEVAEEAPEVEIEVVAGVTAALSGGALLGAPLGHDFCVVSLSDLLTPWDLIERRLRAAAEGDYVIVIYNPRSRSRADHLKTACGILAEKLPSDRPCGLARNIGRDGESAEVCTLEELKEKDADMFTTVFIGNSMSRVVNGRLVTPRGYRRNG